MPTITPGDREDKPKNDNDLSPILDTTIFSENQFPYTRASILIGLCPFCDRKAAREVAYVDNTAIFPDALKELIPGRPYICETSECKKKWDDLTIEQIRILTTIRASFG